MATFRPKEERNFRLVTENTGAPQTSLDFNKIKLGNVVLRDDVLLNTDYKKIHRKFRFSREDVVRAVENQDLRRLREISNYWFVKSGIYSRLCRYMAYLFKYDYFVVPIQYDEKIKVEKVIEGWYKSARFLDNSELKATFGQIALEVIKDGCYYGYAVTQKNAA